MSFIKGKSGNPGGRPKQTAMERREELEARRHASAALRTLVRNLECGKPAAEVQAAKEILDRAWGKPKQQTQLTGADGNALSVRVHLPDWLGDIMRNQLARKIT